MYQTTKLRVPRAFGCLKCLHAISRQYTTINLQHDLILVSFTDVRAA